MHLAKAFTTPVPGSAPVAMAQTAGETPQVTDALRTGKAPIVPVWLSYALLADMKSRGSAWQWT